MNDTLEARFLSHALLAEGLGLKADHTCVPTARFCANAVDHEARRKNIELNKLGQVGRCQPPNLRLEDAVGSGMHAQGVCKNNNSKS